MTDVGKPLHTTLPASVTAAKPATSPLDVAETTLSPPRAIAGTERAQLALAGVLWLAAATMLGTRGAGWLMGSKWTLVLALAAVVLGVVKARFLLDRVARSAAVRIRERGPDAPVAGFLSLRSWVSVGAMMTVGFALRLLGTPHLVLGLLYTAITTALLVASRVYWCAFAKGWSALG
ncbi:MAG: hypothetical protein RBS78_04660 [Coriobacteriia bacterium]|nr:hypothetical protein [Coriobacteriia bacterium]